jgi:mono/diheme cytochrome c family protein
VGFRHFRTLNEWIDLGGLQDRQAEGWFGTMSPMMKRTRLAAGLLASAGFFGIALLGMSSAETMAAIRPGAKASPGVAVTTADRQHMLQQYCSGCHNDKLKTAGMSVQQLNAEHLVTDDAAWEAILRRLSLGEMPPKGMPRPSKEQITDFTHWLATSLDSMAVASPNPGRATLRRLNRTEYGNAVRDLLGLDIDVSKDLPADDTGYGFDNIADVLTVSPTLMDRYMSVADRISHLATGQASRTPVSNDYKLNKDQFENAFGIPSYNERASSDLPVDSRGGGSFKFYAPYDATYTIQLYLNAGTSTETEIDANNRYEVKVPLKAGLRTIGASFPKRMALDQVLIPRSIKGPRTGLPPTVEQIPLDVQVDGLQVKELFVPTVANGPNVAQAFYQRDVMQISVVGPYDVKGPGDTASRRKIFICRPSAALAEAACARKIVSTLARHAYRRPVTEMDIAPLIKIYNESRSGADFDHGIEAALEEVLVSPNFLFMRESDPKNSAPGSVHRISDIELATRLSFFLWSSIPDDQLLSVAERNQLHTSPVLKQQVARMLADPKSWALTQNFAGQWLYLRRLEYQKPDRDEFPDFDQRLRAAMLTETQMFFNGIVRENRSVLDFLNANYTYVNQRLAEHYGIAGVYGTSFRKVQLDPALHRGGLLGQGSILTVTSYNDRTSVVLRGKWILENLLAAPPPPPPPNVPALDAAKNGKQLTVREQMELHRSNPVCASCHTKMDPLGFSLENYNAVGAWRAGYAGQKVDASAVLPDGTQFDGPQGLQGILLARKDQFVQAFTGQLLTYGLGRGLEAYDMPAVRKISYAAAGNGYRMNTIIMGIVQSVPFDMRRTPQK